MIIDKLYKRVQEYGHVCLGLDTSLEYIPQWFKEEYDSIADIVYEFNKKIIDVTLDVTSCYKVQIAYYEALGLEGLIAYKRTLEYLRKKEAIIIADIKRGDIAKTAEMYAKAHFTGDFESDFITLSPYMGIDSIEPYMDYILNNNKGIFPLIRTSNKGAVDLQYIEEKDSNKKVYEIIGEKLKSLGEECMGQCGYSSIGGVVGCTHREQGELMRRELDTMFFLIPGYGAQGGGAEDVAIYLKNGNGGVVNSSRGILLAYKKHEDGERNFEKYAREEVINMRDSILKAIK